MAKGKSIVIVESPAKAKTINKYLGSKYVVRASMGHVRDLPKSKIGVDIEKEFAPHYITMQGRKKLVTTLKKELKDADALYLAPDPDREGEAIAWHLMEALDFDRKKTFRVTFNEITARAVKEAFEHPGKLDHDKIDSQQARRILDRIVGYKISPLLWKKVGSGLSAGRVQTVAVRLICEREEEVLAFVPKEYWSVEVLLEKASGEKEKFWADLKKIEDRKIDIGSGALAGAVVEELKTLPFTVKDIRSKEKTGSAYPPFTTSHLQQASVNKLGWSIVHTMSVAQQLYEGLELGAEGSTGLITYMRTDSFNVSKGAQDEALSYIKEKYGAAYAPEVPNAYKAKKGAQEAHEAIRPSSVLRDPESIRQYLTPDQFKLYKLIWDRFLASQMAPAKYNVMTVDIAAGKYLFQAGGSTVIFPGYTIVYREEPKEDEEVPEEERKAKIPALTAGEALSPREFKPGQHFTKPPPRYTEATLVKALEEKGIGRPSTYAPTIMTIIRRSYVSKEKGRLIPSQLGKSVTKLLIENFPVIFDIDFTAQMENNLDNIEKGKIRWITVLEDFYKPFAETLVTATAEMRDIKQEVQKTDQVCEKCGKPMLLKMGRFGQFLACSSYPECKTTRSVPTGVKCPKCGGDVVKRKSKKGSTFYGCSKYPGCDFVAKFLSQAQNAGSKGEAAESPQGAAREEQPGNPGGGENTQEGAGDTRQQ
jgi:DNA topoisomerase-1